MIVPSHKRSLRANDQEPCEFYGHDLIAGFPIIAQQPADASRVVTASDYARAEKWMGYNTNPLVFRSGVRPAWQGDDRFWYRVTTPEAATSSWSTRRREPGRPRSIK